MTNVSRIIYRIAAWVFVVWVIYQVFAAGMVAVAQQWDWAQHRGPGVFVSVPVFVMLITAYTGRLPGRMKRLTWLLFLVLVVQILMVVFRHFLPVLGAFHPVLALAVFGLAVMVALRAGSLEEPITAA